MGIFKKGDKIKIRFGGEAIIKNELGSGGQGTVYQIKFDGKDYALKWYHKGIFGNKTQLFYENIINNIEKGSPNDNFLWPLHITEFVNNSFGYIMELRPKDYYEFTQFLTGTKKYKQIHFHSFEAIINAGINIIQAFRALHKKGYSYQDLNNGNFFINENTGDVLICDNDNVAADGKNFGIRGKDRYMAPEIVVDRKKTPNVYSDRFSMAIILFRLLFINHPLEGKNSIDCITNESIIEYYGRNPIFVFDPNNKNNRPIPGADINLKKFWPIYPEYIRELFIKAFSNEAMHDGSKRVLEQEWLKKFLKLKAGIIRCPYCNEETFIEKEGNNKCVQCNKDIPIPAMLEFSDISIPLYPTSKVLYGNIDYNRNDAKEKIAEVVISKKDNKSIGIINRSNLYFKVNLPNGLQKPIEPGGGVPVKKGLIIDFIEESKNKVRIV